MTSDEIKLIDPVEHILIRPSLYIGHTWDTTGFHALIGYIIKYAVVPEYCNQCTRLIVAVGKQGEIIIQDNGRGLPTTLEPVWGNQNHLVPAIEYILSRTFTGLKERNFYQEFGFLAQLGLILSAVSETLTIETTYDAVLQKVVCSKGEIIEQLHPIPFTEIGTRITFMPRTDIFTRFNWNGARIIPKLKTLAEQYPNIQFRFENQHTGTVKEFNMDGVE